jgi:hypothetical protein
MAKQTSGGAVTDGECSIAAQFPLAAKGVIWSSARAFGAYETAKTARQTAPILTTRAIIVINFKSY